VKEAKRLAIAPIASNACARSCWFPLQQRTGDKNEEDKACICDTDSGEVDPITPDAVSPVQRHSHENGNDRKEQEVLCILE
jgi:hypothetical protein